VQATRLKKSGSLTHEQAVLLIEAFKFQTDIQGKSWTPKSKF
jgi:hypothetical protein